ncbi:MAG TPA: hypothetical protein DDW31_03990, partial [candidate division Zixibacteria bacterium]|nr:hypothetical protein [candidate division Zixibacteria bacterium]
MKKALIVGLVLAFTAGLCLAAGTPSITSTITEGLKAKDAAAGPDYSTPYRPYVKKSGGKAWQLQEGFEGSFLPAGWDSARVSGTYSGYLTRVTSGTYPTCTPHSGTYMVKWYCFLASAGNRMRLMTPPVRIGAANDSLSFWMTHSTGYPTTNDRIVVEKMVKSGGTWGSWVLVDSFSRYQPAFSWAYKALPLGMHNGDSVRISLTCHSMYGDNIYLDDVSIGSAYTPTAGDLELYSIDAPAGSYMAPDEAFTPAVTVSNPGTTPVSNYRVVFDIDDGTTKALVYTDTVDVAGPLDPGNTYQAGFDGFTPQGLSNYYVTAFVDGPDDTYSGNDTLTSYFRTFNELQGQVADDNAGGAGLAGVKVKVTGPATDSTFTDGSGDYFFFDLAAGTYTVTAAKAGYITETATGITITDNMQTTLDLSMGYPVLVLTPTDSIYCILPWGGADSTTWQFTLENQGTRDMAYSVSWPELVKGAKAPVSLVLDDGSRDNDIGIGGTAEFIWVNRFTPAGGEFPFRLQQVQLYFSALGNVAIGHGIQIVVYENTTGNNDPAVGSNLLYQYNTTVQAVDAWNVYDLPDEVLLNGPGDVVIGVIGLHVPGTSYWPASIDQTATQQRSWAGWWTTVNHPEPPTLPPDDSWILIDAYFPGNWMIRGYGETGSGSVAWLDVAPATGTVPAYDTGYLTVTFDAAGLD